MAFRTFKIYEEIKTATIINCRCHFWKIYDHFEWVDGEDENIPQDFFRNINQYCSPRKGKLLNQINLEHQILTNASRIRSSACNIKEKDQMIREKIGFSWPGKVQLLLRNDGLDLKKTNKICQCLEQANRQSEEIKKDNQASVYKVSEPKLQTNKML